MQGHNKRFISNTLQYLQQNALLIPQALAPVVGGGGIAVFDLQPIGAGQTSLINWAAHPRSTRWGTQRPISAYWLPWVSTTTQIRALGAAADFMFTPELNGCYIGVDAGLPTVAHVAGDIVGAHLLVNLVNAATVALGAAPARRFNSNPMDATAVTFVGRRNRTTGVWTFYAQGNTGNVGHAMAAGGIVREHVYNTAALALAEGFPGQANQDVVTV